MGISTQFTFWQWIGILAGLYAIIAFVPVWRNKRRELARLRLKEAVNSLIAFGTLIYAMWLITFWACLTPVVIRWIEALKATFPTEITKQALNGMPFGFIASLWLILFAIFRLQGIFFRWKYTDEEKANREEERKRFRERMRGWFRRK